ncbi:hypothetical protein Q0Z83_064770 [Actinoplanes sichuanensis]|uniref:TlpA family protein disulfide reductase n=1 Tax=Actinoplanes sichuanensis TaxID=512349 RepID=A0ABW4AMR9_9ACTN|nr:hypothetical protein [Actinoplanes sichuanensis]BEL08286.1 hypothetical protein Q0Z83_064770 [Actinoplanes sichuanensis]
MTVLVTAVVILALVSALNMLLILSVARQTQRNSELLWPVAERGVPAKALPVGATVGPVDGAWAGDTLVAFLVPGCGSCREVRRQLRPRAARWPGGRDRVLVVVTGRNATKSYAASLAGVARVVVDTDETVRTAFGVRGLPALFVVAPDGELTWTGVHVEAVPEPVEASR